VDVLQDARPDGRVQVRLHELEDEVNVAVVVCLEHIRQCDNVLVSLHFLKEHHLAERPLRIGRILKCIEYLF